MMTGLGTPCGACKFLRRKCVRGCIFAPYFCYEHGSKHFAAIHKVFGASNVSKLLNHLPVPDRCEAAVTITYEAQARLQDPVYGCVGHIFALQQQVVNLQAQLSSLNAQVGFTLNRQEEKALHWMPAHQQNAPGLVSEELKMMQLALQNPQVNHDPAPFHSTGLTDPACMQALFDQQLAFSGSCGSPSPIDELQRLAFSGLRNS